MGLTGEKTIKRHVKIYLEANGYTIADIILCEIRADGCQNVSVDICHISHKGMGGNPDKDVNENLLAGCRNCHDKSEFIDKDKLREIARRRINANLSY